MGAGGFLGLLLIVGIAIVALIWFARSASRRGQPAAAGAGAGGSNFDAAPQAQPMQYAGAGAAAGAAAPVMASGLAGGFGIPAGFDKAGFEDNAKKQFMTLQGANDKGDLDGVRNFVTDEAVGLSLLFRLGLRIDFTYTRREREFSGQNYDDRFGSVTVSAPL